MASLPTISSNIPRDLRQFLERVRESIGGRGEDEVVTVRKLVAAGIAGYTGGSLVPTEGATSYGTPPAPTGLTATGALASIILAWDAPVYRGHAYTEVWAAEAPAGGGAPDLGEALLVGMAPGSIFAHNLGGGASRWYWVKFVNLDGQAGPFNAVEGTRGETGQDPAYLLELLSGEVTESQLYQTLGERIDLVDADASVEGSVAARIAAEATTRADADTSLAQSITTLQSTVNGNTTAIQTEATARVNADNTLFAQYTVKVEANGYVSGFGLASTANNAAPTSEFIVRADTFAIASPSGPGIAPSEPFIVRTTATTLNGVSVSTGVYIKDAFIQNGSISNAKIGNAAIDTAKIADAAITTAKIGDAQITTAKIGAAQITNALVASAAIGTANIQNAAVDTAQIKDAAITNAKIANATINIAKINTASIDDLSSLSADIGTITAGKMQSSDGKFVIDLDNKRITITV
jgi:hypothetical protein